MTINKIVSSIRTLIKKQIDDSEYSDEFLYNLFNDARVALLSSKKYELSNQDYKTFCIELEKTKSHLCGSTKIGCEVYTSIYKLPSFINSSKLKITDVGGNLINEILEQDVDIVRFNKILSKKLHYTLINNKPVIWCSHNRPQTKIIVKAIWQDILDWQSICCDKDCVNVLETEIVSDRKLLIDCYKIVLDLLKLPLSLVEDVTSDTNNNIKQ